MSGLISSGHPFVMSSFSLKPWIHSPISTILSHWALYPGRYPIGTTLTASRNHLFWLSLPNGKQAIKMRRNDENEIQIVTFLSLSL